MVSTIQDDKAPTKPGWLSWFFGLQGATMGFCAMVFIVCLNPNEAKKVTRSGLIQIGVMFALVSFIGVALMMMMAQRKELPIRALRWPIFVVVIGWVLGAFTPYYLGAMLRLMRPSVSNP